MQTTSIIPRTSLLQFTGMAVVVALSLFVIVLSFGAFGLNADAARVIICIYSIATLIITLLLWSAYHLTRPAILIVFGAQIYWFAWPAFATAMDRSHWFSERVNYPLNDYDVVIAAGLLWCFSLLFLSSYVFFSRPQASAHDLISPQNRNGNVFSAPYQYLLVLFALGLLPFIVYGNSPEQILQGILGSRSVEKAWAQAAFESNPIYIIGRSSLVTFGLLCLASLFSGTLRSRFILLIGFIFAFLVTFLDSGTRTWTLLILMPALLIRLTHKSLSRPVFIAFLVISLPAIYLLGRIQLMARDTGFSIERGSLLQLVSLWEQEDKAATGDNDFFSETAVAASLVPGKMDYIHEVNLVLFLTNPIPRSLWPEKPYPKTIQMYSLGRTGFDEYLIRGNSRMPSIVGQYHMNWGAGGVVFIGFIYGLLTAWIDKLWIRAKRTYLRIFLATLIAWLFISYRGMFPGFHYPVILTGLLALYEYRNKAGPPYIIIPQTLEAEDSESVKTRSSYPAHFEKTVD